MVRHVDAIFTQGSFRPIEPLALPEGTRVRLSVEEHKTPGALPAAARMRTPKLAHAEDAADFVMEVRGSSSLIASGADDAFVHLAVRYVKGMMVRHAPETPHAADH